MRINRVAILGGYSFLATYLCRHLKAKGFQVDLYSQYNPPFFYYPYQLPHAENLIDYDLIILTAAAGVQARKSVTSEAIFGLNAFFPIQLIYQLEQYKFGGKLITFGSYFEIGDCSTTTPFNEEDVIYSKLPATSEYVISKRLLSRFRSSYNSAFAWYHLILPSIYGKGEDPSRLIPYLIRGIQHGEKLQVTQGKQLRQYLHVEDVLSFIKLLTESEIQSGMYNLAPDHPISIADLRTKLIELVSKVGDMQIEIISMRDENMKVLKLNAAKANAIGWRPLVSLDEGILSYLI